MSVKILVVDDDARILNAFSRRLRLEGHTVITVDNGETALDLYAQENPDLVFTDVRMPPPDGFAVLQHIRKEDPDAEVILITGHSDMQMAIDALRAGATDFIPKPVDSTTLSNALRHALERLTLKRELRTAQEKLHRYAVGLEARVAERTAQLVEANMQLKTLDRLKAKFIADISHELRTPMTNIILFMELLEHGSPQKRPDYMNGLKDQVLCLKSIIDDILSFAESDMHQPQIKFTSVDLNTLIQQIVPGYQTRADELGLDLMVDLDPNLPLIRGSAKRLLQMVMELLDNAMNYTSEGKVEIRTRLTEQPGQIALEVQDSGRGIPESDIPYLFKRFYRGQNVGSFSTPGTGLGLAVVKDFVTLHSGEIEVESELGVGSTFRVRLLLMPPDPQGYKFEESKDEHVSKGGGHHANV